jgi:SAM-dependent methyltransferase
VWPWRPYGEEGPTLLQLARQAWSSTDRGYDLLATRFDATPFRTPDHVVEAALSVLGDARFELGLDLCCGTGAGLRALARRAARVVGVDRSAGMLHEARAKAPGAFLVRGDALRLPLRARFDVVVSFGAFGHILVEDEPLLVANVRAALAPGGRFLFITSDPPRLLSRRAVEARAFNAAMRVRNAVKKPPFVMYYLTFLLPRARRLLEAAGFSVREHRGVVDGHVVVEALA